MGISPISPKKKKMKGKKRDITLEESPTISAESSSTSVPEPIKTTEEAVKKSVEPLKKSVEPLKKLDQPVKSSSRKRKEKNTSHDSSDDFELPNDFEVPDDFDTQVLKEKNEPSKKRKLIDGRKKRKRDEELANLTADVDAAKKMTEELTSQSKRTTSSELNATPIIPKPTPKITDESFTAIKRNVGPKTAPAPLIGIDQIVDTVKRKPLALTKYPEQRPNTITPKKITFVYNNFPKHLPSSSSTTLPSSLPPSSTLQIRPSSFQERPTLSQSRPAHPQQPRALIPPPRSSVSPPQPRPIIHSPPLPPPPTLPSTQPVPIHPGNRNQMSSTAGQIERIDPRIRVREAHISHISDTVHRTVSPVNNIHKDPRRSADNVDKIKRYNMTAFPTPFVLDTLLYSGTKFISTVTIQGHQTCYHETQIKELISLASSNQKEIRATFTVPLKALNTILLGKSISFMSITPKNRFIDLSKLKSYYQVNEMSGVMHHPDMKQALILLAEEDVKKLSNLPSDTGFSPNYTRLCAVFIDGLIPRPKSLSNEISYEIDPLDPFTPYQWNLVAEYLKFPEQLKRLKTKSKFLVYGSSDATAMLGKAISHLRPVPNPPTSYVMMFDRYNETYFSRNLTKHKKESATQIWEFGVPDYSCGEMIPAIEIFPNHSGGFVTTDMENITQNPKIIEIIHDEITKLNSMPTIYGEWKFILPHNWLSLLKATIKDQASGQRAKDAIVAIALALSSDTINILKLWCGDTDELNHLQYLNRVARNKYKTHQYFVYVDDIHSVPTSQHVFSIDFVKSNKIYSTFA